MENNLGYQKSLVVAGELPPAHPTSYYTKNAVLSRCEALREHVAIRTGFRSICYDPDVANRAQMKACSKSEV